MKQTSFVLCFLLVMVSIGFLAPPDVSAAERISYSSYRSKISKLDDDPVKNIPIPILFGVDLEDLYPNFGDPRDGGARLHEGFDIMAPEGAPIVSPTEAVVVRTGSGSSSGKTVSTANPGGETFIYMHLSEILVKSGDVLKEGDIIGYVGDTGNAKGGAPHLHFEIRKSRRATDPYLRITKEVPLDEKIEFLENALGDVDDEEDLADFVVEHYSTELMQARAAGLALPEEIVDAFGVLPVAVSPSATPTGDLELGSDGPLVRSLQLLLIAQNIGPGAQALLNAGATGYFGPITQRALIEYQIAHSITPSSGYFGPRTRAQMKSAGISGTWW